MQVFDSLSQKPGNLLKGITIAGILSDNTSSRTYFDDVCFVSRTKVRMAVLNFYMKYINSESFLYHLSLTFVTEGRVPQRP